MEFETSKQFDKLVFKINDKSTKLRLKRVIERVGQAKNLDEIPNITPIVGHPNYYRIKFGDYRVGISLEDNIVWFLYFGKRDENTYKKFP
ncbi:MAG TPA: plasmid stabilization protein [Prolixibacteraceae bacterium]|jgi:mRNA interferase RelE/StbE|nr:plasmid stabilization protein [Prolixibacteraceae bacterium]